VRLNATVASVILTIALATGASGQARPDFSGRWTIVPPATAPTGRGATGGGGRAGDMGSGWGSTITLTQSASALTLEWVYYATSDLQPPLVFVYPLDGSEKVNTLMMGRGFEKQVSRAVWDDAKLIITTTQDFPNVVAGRTVTSVVTRTLTLESPTSLVVETNRSAVLGGQPSTTRTVYTKQ
jgi:hypothetical protein